MKGSHPKGSYKFICPFKFINPRRCEGFAYTLFTNGTGYSIRVVVDPTWTVFDDVVEFGKSLYPSCKDTFRSSKCFKPLKAMVIRSKDNVTS